MPEPFFAYASDFFDAAGAHGEPYVNAGSVHVSFADLDPSICAHQAQNEITYSRGCWASDTDEQRRWRLYHELGHWTGRVHTPECGQVPDHIMCPAGAAEPSPAQVDELFRSPR